MNDNAPIAVQVARAIGIEVELLSTPRSHPVFYIQNTAPFTNGFHPDTDWNDAMLAAEKAELFDDYSERYMQRNHLGEWVVVKQYSFVGGGSGVGQIAQDPSGPLCICKAILSLKPPAAT